MLHYIKWWIKTHFTKQHLKMTWKAFVSNPYDFSCTEEFMRYRLLDLLHYFEGFTYIDTKEIISRIKLAIKLNEIVTEKKELFTYEKPLDFDYKRLQYKCLVNVNLRNMNRFSPDGCFKIYELFPHELYIVKAKHLYYKILYENSWMWGD